ncbi:hypothetical protein HP570_29055 [Brevibacillus sp. RS1.1]|uniref:hypothetical protein n=1 Tax=Brevibacillus sp. RS1.1 TaxID=2738982 RepID=UPI00156B42ED|nr:hypothetical protein [Brevibacillus sp. RS1.1]NRR06244.1 hypothetical protein [Brevibacillus sp. RS1.1]
MGKPVSIFIMDVTKSTDIDNPDLLTEYLSDIVQWIKRWTDDIVSIKVKHRLGDEIILISENYSTAFIIAFFINQCWQFKRNPPYFGMTIGDIDKDISDIDIETWNHPLIKQARIANDTLKNESNRVPFLFRVDNNNISGNFKQLEEMIKLINLTCEIQFFITTEQTEQQKLIFFLYLILQKQVEIAKLLNKSASTISVQYKKGNGEIILKSFEQVKKSLNAVQDSIYSEESSINEISENLRRSIMENIKSDLTNFLSLK